MKFANVLALAILFGSAASAVISTATPNIAQAETAMASITNNTNKNLTFTFKGQNYTVGADDVGEVPIGATIQGTILGFSGTYQVRGNFKVMGDGPFVVLPGGNLRKK